MMRRNARPDEELRELERRARAGDAGALLELNAMAEQELGPRPRRRSAGGRSWSLVEIQTRLGPSALAVVGTSEGGSIRVTLTTPSDARPQRVPRGLGAGNKFEYLVAPDGTTRLAPTPPGMLSAAALRWIEKNLTPLVQNLVTDNLGEIRRAALSEASRRVAEAEDALRSAEKEAAKARAELAYELAREAALGGSPLSARREDRSGPGPKAEPEGRAAGISPELRRIFEIEIENEHLEETGSSRSGASSPGGANPATLGSVLDSIRQGLEVPGEAECQSCRGEGRRPDRRGRMIECRRCFGDRTVAPAIDELRALIATQGEDAEVRRFMTEPSELVECATCGKRIRFADSYSPGDEAICAACDTEVTGRPHPEVSAEARSDDGRIQIDFDATAWFEQASDEELEALARMGWCRGYEADAVARHFEEEDVRRGSRGETKRLFDYLATEPTVGGERVGFECSVNVAEAENWVFAHREDLARRLGLV